MYIKLTFVCHCPVFLQEEVSFFQNHGSFKFSKLFSAYSFCVISKYPYFTALKDCLSWWETLYERKKNTAWLISFSWPYKKNHRELLFVHVQFNHIFMLIGSYNVIVHRLTVYIEYLFYLWCFLIFISRLNLFFLCLSRISLSIFLSLSVCLFVSLLIQLRTCRLSDMEERVKEFAAKLALVPIPPPGQLHLVCVCICMCAQTLQTNRFF